MAVVSEVAAEEEGAMPATKAAVARAAAAMADGAAVAAAATVCGDAGEDAPLEMGATMVDTLGAQRVEARPRSTTPAVHETRSATQPVPKRGRLRPQAQGQCCGPLSRE